MGMKYGRPVDNLAVRVASATVPILINGNGSYTSAPAKDEDTQFPMSHLYSQDRYRVWSTKVGNADTAIKVHIDLSGGANGAGAGGADVAVSSAALLGLRPHAGAVAPGIINVGSRTRAQGYAATGYTFRSAFGAGQGRDSICLFTETSARYWEFDFTTYPAAGFALGSFWLGVLQDVGIFWSADGGATWAEEHNVLLSSTAGGHQTAVSRGDPWARYTLSFRAITNATRTTLETRFGAAQRGQPILILDENSVPRQFLVTGGPQFSQRFDGVYEATINLERLG